MGLSKKETMEMKVVEAFNEAKRRRRLREEFSHFCDETSFTLLTRIHRASSIRRQIGWTIVLLIMLAWLIVGCYSLFELFLSYPIEIKMDILAAPEGLEFPSVTVCNMNPIRKSEATRDPDFGPLKVYTNKINDNDRLFELSNQNWDKNFPSRTPSSAAATPPRTTQTLTPQQTTGAPQTTTKAPSTPMASGTNAPAPTAANMTAQASQTTGMPPPGRRKRDLSNNNNGDPLTGPDIYPANPDNPARLGNSPVLYEATELDGFARDGDHEEAWRRLESDVFEGESHAGRSKRSVDDERIEQMMNNSFNKWDALETDGMNISYYETRGCDYKAAMAYATLTAKLPPDAVKESGYSLETFMITCTFNGYPCSPKNFSYFHSYKYGNCYTFNSHEMDTDLYTKFAGPDYGLTLEMFIQQDQYVPALAAEAGVRVLIHTKGTMPFPEDMAISVSPEHSTSVSLRKIQITRLEPPHGACGTTAEIEDKYVNNLNTTYSKLSCLKSCYQDIVERHCNCSSPMFYVEDRERVCDLADDDVDKCTSRLHASVPTEYDDCDTKCPQSCLEVEYDMLVSSAAWPSDSYASYLQTKVQQSNYLLMKRNFDESDFVKLNVFFRDLVYQTIEQQKSYEMQNLLSDFGGQLGLWLGLSAITLGEVLGLVLSVFRSLTTTVGPDDGTSSSTPIRPFTNSPELMDVNIEDVLMSDVKKKGFPALGSQFPN